MTIACIITLTTSLCLYFAASILLHVSFVISKSRWREYGLHLILAGLLIQIFGMFLHAILSNSSPFSNMLVIVSWLVIIIITIALLVERFTKLRYLVFMVTPLAFVALLYPLLMPVEFRESEIILLRFPWLGAHVVLTLVGYVGQALAFCTATTYILQKNKLKQGSLNQYLPALDTASKATFYFASAGFFCFTLGLSMGIICYFDAPGEFLHGQDLKIWMALPTWMLFGLYLYRRGIRRDHGSKLKWLIILGFLTAITNLVAIRHDYDEQYFPILTENQTLK